jgi:Zn-dependent M28 family amino/carboxypeptidase
MAEAIEGAVSLENLKEHVRQMSILRHGVDNYAELERVATYVENFFSSLNIPVRNQYFEFQKRRYRNIVATVEGTRPELPALLVGAHYDGNRNTPGADDNASGVAAMFEIARILRQSTPTRRVEFVAFTLEEPQTFTHIIRRGSRFFAREARRAGVSYEGAVILECIGYVAPKQKGALLARLIGLPVPKVGDFLAVVANRPSKRLMEEFLAAASHAAPALKTVAYALPAQGYPFPQARFSDHSSFWERDYPAIMLNDTVMFRNPHYHKATDVPETLNFCFMAGVARAVLALVQRYR